MTAAVLGQKDHADRVTSHWGEFKVHPSAHEGVGDLYQNAGAVARPGIGPHGTAVSQADQDLETLVDDLPALDVLDVADEADAAGIMLIGGVVKSLGFG